MAEIASSSLFASGAALGSFPTVGTDILSGTSGRDLIDLLAGADIYDGGGGNDFIHGGPGSDTIRGGAGDDIIRGDNAWGYHVYNYDFATLPGQAFDFDLNGFLIGSGETTDLTQVTELAKAARNSPVEPDDFGIVFTSLYYAPVAGDYRFTTTSDDGSTMRLFKADGTVLTFTNQNGDELNYLDNDYAQGPTTRWGDVTLEAGMTYIVEIRFWEAIFGQALDASVTPPGGSTSGLIATGAANDNLTGGLGKDEIHGGRGDDTMHVFGGDMVAGEIYDGGAGVDTLRFVGGTSDLNGVTLTSVENIILDDPSGTHVILADNAQVSLIRSAIGEVDRITLKTPVRADIWDQSGLSFIQSIFDLGVEEVEWNGGWDGNNVAERDADGVVTITSTDTSGQPWDTRVTVIDPDGRLFTETRVYDDGRMTAVDYVDGIKVSYEQIDIDDRWNFSSLRKEFHANGQVAMQTTVFDAGRSLEKQVLCYDENGLRTDTVQEFADGRTVSYQYNAAGNIVFQLMEDTSGTRPWTSSSILFDDHGDVTGQYTVRDNGNVIAKGGAGDDLIFGGAFNDTLWGFGGADIFKCSAGSDRIRDFSLAQGDRLDLVDYGVDDIASLLANATIRDLPNALVLDFGGGDVVRIDGIHLADLSDNDFFGMAA